MQNPDYPSEKTFLPCCKKMAKWNWLFTFIKLPICAMCITCLMNPAIGMIGMIGADAKNRP
jgi:hypothetical protein